MNILIIYYFTTYVTTFLILLPQARLKHDLLPLLTLSILGFYLTIAFIIAYIYQYIKLSKLIDKYILVLYEYSINHNRDNLREFEVEVRRDIIYRMVPWAREWDIEVLIFPFYKNHKIIGPIFIKETDKNYFIKI